MTELLFKGKEFVFNHHLTVPYRPLEPHPRQGVGGVDLSGNLLIQGDNLHALKALKPMYAGKVDCIFIDPPYNTGNEKWSYNDNVNAPQIKEWLNDNPITVEDTLRHDKWCAMMWPRLRLLHELLAESGSMWITLDDNEAHRAKLMLDEIFQGQNFVANVVWQKRTSPDARATIGAGHDHILVFAKDFQRFRTSLKKLPMSEKQRKAYTNPDSDPRGAWTSSDFTAQGFRPNQMYEIKTPAGKVFSPPPGRCWKNIEPVFRQQVRDGRIWFGVDGDSIPRRKTYLSETEGVSSWTWWQNTEVGHNQEAKKEVNKIFGAENAFITPKPERLISRILELSTEEGDLVLDSFAGSGTTAAVAQKMGRKWITVEMESSIASTVTAKRCKTAIVSSNDTEKSQKSKKSKDVERQKFTYCTLGEPIELNILLSGGGGGGGLPDFDALGPVLFHIASNCSIDHTKMRSHDFYLGEANSTHFWLIYKPDKCFLKSNDAALTLSRARKIAMTDSDRQHLVFAPARFVSRKLLAEEGLAVDFLSLPDALYNLVQA